MTACNVRRRADGAPAIEWNHIGMLIVRAGRRWRRRVGAAALAAWGLLVSSCGGGTSQIEPFTPERIVILGDENAGLTSDGKRFAINGIDANAAIDCSQLQIWTQLVVAAYGMTLDRCNPGGLIARGITRAAPNAKAADLPAQIDAQLATGPLNSKDLFLVMVGMNDVIERYEAGAGCDDADLRARGQLVAAQVNRLVAEGARVIVSTVHDLGLTPYARTREAANAGQMAQLTCLTATFNARVRVDIINDGRFIGLILADDTTQLAVKFPSTFTGLVNVTDVACTTAAPDCTTSTLVSGADSVSHMWADDRHFAQTIHTRLAVLAETRARNNPF